MTDTQETCTFCDQNNIQRVNGIWTSAPIEGTCICGPDRRCKDSFCQWGARNKPGRKPNVK